MSSERKGPIVIKIGGSTLGNADTTLADVVTLQQRGTIPVVVHGGGKVISQWMERTGALPRFVRGLRVTDAPTLEVVVAVLTGLVNKQLVAAIQALGGRAVGLSGVDGGVLQARVLDPELGFVGEVTQVQAGPILELVRSGYIPVVAPVGIGCAEGTGPVATLLNINGDTAAGELAAALRARSLVFLTDVEGVMDSSRRVIPRLTAEQARALVAGGVVVGGMIPKVEACLKALPLVGVAQIVDGRRPHALLECMDGRTLGTQVG
ncbi:MAG: acetylglutamate kinase [Chloroflexi bacterium]|nr:acetylglutamate kinase [Chloroflexota bacterium]